MEGRYETNQLMQIIEKEIDAIYIIDESKNTYVKIKGNPLFDRVFGEKGNYDEMLKALVFHFNDKSEEVAERYHVFLSNLNKFDGKYSKRIKMFVNDEPVIAQMTIYPHTEEGKYIILITEMDNNVYVQDFLKFEKELGIDSTYLFTMHVNLDEDICNSVCVTEMSDDPMNYTGLKFSQWRMNIVNMIFPDDQNLFLEYTDPEFLRNHLESRRSTSIDCQMMNLEGKYIWVKLIFKKIQKADDSFCFVFMVQDIHDTSMKLIEDLKKYEEMSNRDPLTGIYNHGKIKEELTFALKRLKDDGTAVSLAMFDIDYFKNVNDTYGHATGDYVIRSISGMVNEYLSEYNTHFGRWGGEEFVIIANEIDSDELQHICEELRIRISNYKFSNVNQITCSFGVIGVTPEETSLQAFERVDKAMYKAKSNGRNCVVCG